MLASESFPSFAGKDEQGVKVGGEVMRSQKEFHLLQAGHLAASHDTQSPEKNHLSSDHWPKIEHVKLAVDEHSKAS